MELQEVKNYLNITWNDADMDQKITGVMERALGILEDYAGAAVDFSKCGGFERQLYLDCCRYIFNNAFEDFKISFGTDLTALRLKYQLEEADGDGGETA